MTPQSSPPPTLIGYDARTWSPTTTSNWPDERRQQYLLNPDAPMPLSVDRIVWPSPLLDGQSWIPDDTIAQLGQTALTPEFIGPNAPFWSDLEELVNFLSRSALDPATMALIEVHRLDPGSTYQAEPAKSLLGYDVADEGFISSLMNCAVEPQERDHLTAAFASGLNPLHLFTSASLAHRFREASNDLIPEHAPFSVYAIYNIQHKGLTTAIIEERHRST